MIADMIAMKSMKVLVVEDDCDVRNSLSDILTDHGSIVDTVADGEEGLYRASEWKYDVIVLDVMLPKLTGWQVLDQLRKKKIALPCSC